MKKFLRKFSILQDFNKIIYRRKWRKLNKHNYTIAKNKYNFNNVYVGNGTYGDLNIYSFSKFNEHLSIGNYCSIAPNVSFLLSGEHNYKLFSTYPFSFRNTGIDESISKGDIKIDDDVWIGFGAIILSGVHIGKGAVVGAGSIVAKDIPPYAIYVGNKVIKYRFSPDIIEKLDKIDYSKIGIEDISQDLLYELNSENIDEFIKKINEIEEKNK